MNRLAIICTLFLLLTRCKEETMPAKPIQLPSLNDISQSSWERLSTRKIFFAHQSVGFNIIDGIKDLMKENNQIKLHIVETHDPGDFDQPIFAHSTVGKNQDPHSKIDEFVAFMDKGLGNQVDIAFFKFCYVDITSSTEVDNLFDTYEKIMSALQKKFPKTTFIHFTVPLTTPQSGIKALIKRIIGKPIGIEDNVQREKFNEKLRKAYQEQGNLFDLSKVESTSPIGEIATFKINGEMYIHLNPEYTYNGGHLNEVGREKVAEQLLFHLIKLSDKLPLTPSLSPARPGDRGEEKGERTKIVR